MSSLRSKRASRRVMVLAGIAGVALALAGGIAYATIPGSNGVYTACELNSNGMLRLIDPSLGSTSLLGHCTPNETQVSWSQAGPQGPKGDKGDPGTNGVSVTSSTLASGDTNCPNGGSSFTAANGTTYACNGAAGAAGKDGANGTSVTSTPLAPGDSSCPTGGAQFTAATGTTYACNGAAGKDGADGKDGVSVTSQALSTGDTNCPFGGSSFTSANATTYACNGAPGQSGGAAPAVQVVSGTPTAIAKDGGAGFVTATCPAGKTPISGGWDLLGGGTPTDIMENGPTSNGWELFAQDNSNYDDSLQVIVICM